MSVLKGEGQYPILFATRSIAVQSRTHTAYEAMPDRSGRWPTVILIGGVEGLSSSMRDICRRLARHGFAAVAPDLSRGKLSDEQPQQTQERIHPLAEANVGQVLRDVASYLRDAGGPWDTTRSLGILMYQAGVHAGIHTGTDGGNPTVLVSPELVPREREVDEGWESPRPIDVLGNFTFPILALVGRDDPQAAAEHVAATRAAVPQAQWVIYNGVGADFIDDTSDGYDDSAARDAMKRIVEFFEESL